MADQEEWSSDSNQAVEISIVQAGQESPKTLSTFHPKFTYPIFGDQESVFGYQGLRIGIRFAAHDLRSNIQITHDKRFESVGDTKATNIEETLKDWIPSTAFHSATHFDAHLQNSSGKDFKPPGYLIESYTSRNRDFEIWSGELTDPAVKELIERMQIFISFFVEGGRPLDLGEEEWTLSRWRVFFVYEKLSVSANTNISPYSIVGYSTSYRFLAYQPSKKKPIMQTFTLPPLAPLHPNSLPSRARISQFLILEPHQHNSHGTHLYNAMTRTFLTEPNVFEITVEDPNEAFDDLRDYCDYARLRNNGTFSQIKLTTTVPPPSARSQKHSFVPTSELLNVPILHSLRHKNKLAPRQWARLVELYLLSLIAPYKRQAGVARLTQRGKTKDDDDRAFYYWRLLVKQRVYKQNRDLLIQLNRGERIDKVEQTVGEIAGDYERLLRGLEKRKDLDDLLTSAKNGKDDLLTSAKNGKEEGMEEPTPRGRKRGLGKRRVIVIDDDDDDDDAVEIDAAEGQRAVKRRKESDA